MAWWIENLEIYEISLKLSYDSRKIYKTFNFEQRKIIWDQFIRAIDSIWANISEWYWRYHYLDSSKFYYNARWSLFESKHWINLLHKREFIKDDMFSDFFTRINVLWKKLNNFINSTKSQIS
jgi:four helix bundle protein